MGDAQRRLPIRRSKIGKSNLGAYLQHRLNLLYQKFLKKSTRSAPPPVAMTAACLAEKFSPHF